MAEHRIGRVVPVQDGSRAAYRIEVDGAPLRVCPMCGLFAWPQAAVDHGRKHRVRVVVEEPSNG